MRPLLRNYRPIVFVFVPLCVGTLLFVSAIYSGMLYQFDGDEVFNVQFSWLLTQGVLPYRDFIMLYTPVFHWFIAPIIALGRQDFSTLYTLRFVMVMLFAFRVGLLFSIVRSLFSRKTAGFVLPLLLLDPLYTFSGMQIRPDNLMLTASLFGIAGIIHALQTKRTGWFIVSGALLSLGALVLLKSVPYTAIFLLSLLWFVWQKNMKKYFVPVIIGGLIPIISLLLYTKVAGITQDMIQATLFEAARWASSVRYPTPPSFFYTPDNIYFFGIPGKPLTWLYLWVLPLLSAMGSFSILKRLLTSEKNNPSNILRLGFVVMAWVQWFLFLVSPVIFVQYYLSFNWLFVILAAVGVDDIVTAANKRSAVFRGVFVVLFIMIALTAIRGNVARAQMNSEALEKQYQMMWGMIPPDEPVFSYVLFRPIAYPVSFLGDNSRYLLSRLPSVSESLEKKHVRYLRMNEYHLQYMSSADRAYIRTHFEPQDTLDIWVRKKSAL
ncbi:MAG TPA: glycosyltransferase family 39 protein [Patescibacteria group bacterium]|nr:glycosyltransferase family 39 protein [Patescibacteria group bacterium]